MKKLLEFLRRHPVIGLDTSIFIYHLEDHPRYGPVTADLLTALENGVFQGVTSYLTLMEILVKPKAEGNLEAIRDYEFFLTTFPNLSFVSMGLEVARRAADLRGGYRLRPPDAIQLAAALVHGATAFLTNDKKLKLVSDLKVLILDDWLPG
jgi:predicted nucleic acid-binding protein